MSNTEADFAVPTQTATTTGPVTDPVRARKKGVVGKALDAARKALSADEPQSIADDDDATDSAPVPGPAAPDQPLPDGLEQIAAEHGLPSDIRRHVLSRCKSEAIAVVAANQRQVEACRPVDEMVDVRFAEQRHQRNLDALPNTITECLASAAALNLLKDARNPLVGQLTDAVSQYRRRSFAEHVEKPLDVFVAKLSVEIAAAEEQAKRLDGLIGRLVPGACGACNHVSTRLNDLRQQFRHAEESKRNPVLGNLNTEHGFVALAVESANT